MLQTVERNAGGRQNIKSIAKTIVTIDQAIGQQKRDGAIVY